jgi:hypothetical protein
MTNDNLEVILRWACKLIPDKAIRTSKEIDTDPKDCILNLIIYFIMR